MENRFKYFYNGKIYTNDQDKNWHESIITRDNKIFFVGSDRDAINLCAENFQKIDLQQKLVLPGMIDDHTHFMQGGMVLLGINLRDCKNKYEFKERIRDYALKHPNEWITGGDWDHQIWEQPELPTLELIDEITPNNPVYVNRLDGHMVLVNSLALKIAGISDNAENPIGGTIEKTNGRCTGILKDTAMNLVLNKIPKPSKDKLELALEMALNEAKRFGITSIQDITLDDDLAVFFEAQKESKLSVRIYSRLPIANYRRYYENGYTLGFKNSNIKLGSLKAFSDGSLGSKTAWFFEPYLNSNYTGLPSDIMESGELEEYATIADSLGFNLSVHAIGDKANFEVLNIFKKIKEKNKSWDRRFRIEHAQHIRKEDLQLFKELDVFISAQPYHLIEDGAWTESYIGAERFKNTYAFNSFIKNGNKVGFGSDWTVAPINPMTGIYAAIARKSPTQDKNEIWQPEQRLTLEKAIDAYTINNAYAEYSESEKGSIEINKNADFIVLDKNIFNITPDEILNTNVIMTIFDGNIIFEK